jgi:3-oxoacyl-[acyl-carrier protein] reductase
MGDFRTVSRLFKEIKNYSDGVDVLVNNAGVSYLGLLTDMTAEEWDTLIRTNLSSVFPCCKLAIPYMVDKIEGRIINISSIWGDVGSSCETAYSATKGGMNALTKSLAKELAPSNIQVNAIACGLIDTEMNAMLTREEWGDIINDIPIGRPGSPNEVAELAYYLSESNPYLTGQVINLDGGWK